MLFHVKQMQQGSNVNTHRLGKKGVKHDKTTTHSNHIDSIFVEAFKKHKSL